MVVKLPKANPREAGKPVAPAVKALVLAATVLLTTEAALALLVQLYLKDLGASPLVISLSSSLTWAGILLASPIWGGFGDRYSSRWLAVCVFLGSSLATAPLALLLAAPAVLILGTLRSFLAIGLPPIGMRFISASSTDRNRGRNLSFLSAARAAGWVFGGMLAGFLLARVGYRYTFLIVTLLPVLVIPSLFKIPHRASANGSSSRPIPRQRFDVWTPQLTLLYGAVTLRQLATTGVWALAYVYMASHAISSGVIGVVSAVGPAICVLGTLAVGHIIDRVNRKSVIIFGFAVAILYPLLYSLAETPVMFALAAVPLGLSFAAYYSGSTTHIGKIVPLEYQGTMFGLLDSCRGLGGLIGPILAGILVTMCGYRSMFLVMAAISTLSLALAFVGTRRSPGATQDGSTRDVSSAG